MPEITIRYKSKKTLNALKDLAKYFDFSIVPKQNSAEAYSDYDLIIPPSEKLDLNALRKLFSGKDIDAKELRNSLWIKEK
jgi:hypothetical protein